MKNHQLALITGGSSGIGLALAKALVKQGTDICLLARDLSRLQSAQQEISPLKIKSVQRIETLSCDIREFETLSQKLDQLVGEFGLPDLVINSAGVAYPGYFQELEVETFHYLMDINYFGTVHVLKCLIPRMIARGSGTIVNISSQAGFVGVFGYSAYGASKYAVRGLSDVLRAEMKPLGIQVSIVFPPDTQTPQLDYEKKLKPIETKEIASSARILSPEKVAYAILKGVDKGRYVIIPGFEGKIFYRLINLLGNLIFPVMDWMVTRAQKKNEQNQ
ncbi:MAG: SDR family oxidoreductase [Brevefilum sp.]